MKSARTHKGIRNLKIWKTIKELKDQMIMKRIRIKLPR
tara:strand:+ start:3087 stop:3200 length:114 start_codon:yes stop_codon:yes gene_type:complete